jgi:ribosomal protein S18 acetylase RimI-like enzyme
MKPEVRLGDPGDIDGAARVWARATARRDGKAEIPPLEAARGVVLDSLRDERSTLVVAEDEGVVVGFATADPTASRRVAEVRYVGVDPDCWGSGVGGQVLARLADELAAAEFRSAQLLVYADNAPARRLYERLGWSRSDREPTPHPRTGKPEVRYHLCLMEKPFVPAGFVVPLTLEAESFRLEPLGPQHNEPDYRAWSSSMEHIRATPGWEKSSWPDGRSIDDNLRDLQGHADDFENRIGFTYTALDPATGDVVGCLYIYPAKTDEHDAQVHSWVTKSRAELDVPLWRAVSGWLRDEWPFERVDYAERSNTTSADSATRR